MLSRKIIGKLNIIDLLLITIIVLSIFALIYKAAWGKKSSEYRTYTMVCVCENIPIELSERVSVGDSCVDGTYGTEIGVLGDKSSTPIYIGTVSETQEPSPTSDRNDENAEENGDEDGRERNSSPTPMPTPLPTITPTHSRAVFNVTVEGAETDHGIMIEQNTYLLGQSMQLIIGNAVFDVYISNIY